MKQPTWEETDKLLEQSQTPFPTLAHTLYGKPFYGAGYELYVDQEAQKKRFHLLLTSVYLKDTSLCYSSEDPLWQMAWMACRVSESGELAIISSPSEFPYPAAAAHALESFFDAKASESTLPGLYALYVEGSGKERKLHLSTEWGMEYSYKEIGGDIVEVLDGKGALVSIANPNMSALERMVGTEYIKWLSGDEAKSEFKQMHPLSWSNLLELARNKWENVGYEDNLFAMPPMRI